MRNSSATFVASPHNLASLPAPGGVSSSATSATSASTSASSVPIWRLRTAPDRDRHEGDRAPVGCLHGKTEKARRCQHAFGESRRTPRQEAEAQGPKVQQESEVASEVTSPLSERVGSRG